MRGISGLGPSGMRSTSHQNWLLEGKGKSQMDHSCFGRPIPIDVVKDTMAIALASPLCNSNGLLKMEFEKAAIVARKRVEQLVGVASASVSSVSVASLPVPAVSVFVALPRPILTSVAS